MEIFEPQIQFQRPFQADIVTVNGASFFRTVKRGKFALFRTSLDDIDRASGDKDLKPRPLEEIIPKQNNEFLPVISEELPDQCPEL
jgi:hypothetical protein